MGMGKCRIPENEIRCQQANGEYKSFHQGPGFGIKPPSGVRFGWLIQNNEGAEKKDGNKKTASQAECRFSMKKAVFVQFTL